MISVRCARARRGDLTVRSRHRANPARADKPEWGIVSQPHAKIVIIGGGPGGYEAALVAAQLGADVTVVDSDGLGGACVLTDCVPSKTLIATSGMMSALDGAAALGLRPDPGTGSGAGPAPHGAVLATVDAPRLYSRVKALARAQSADVAQRLAAEGVEVVTGAGRLTGPRTVAVGGTELSADVVLVATGARPRVLPGVMPDGERILTCRQLYDLDELPPELIVIGSGVTGAEFASAYQALGSQVTLVSSRGRVLPQHDADAAMVIEEVSLRRGMTVLGRSRAVSARRDGDGVVVALEDGRILQGSSPSTGYPGPRCRASTRPATAPACRCSLRWRPCRAGSQCGTRSATRCSRCISATSP